MEHLKFLVKHVTAVHALSMLLSTDTCVYAWNIHGIHVLTNMFVCISVKLHTQLQQFSNFCLHTMCLACYMYHDCRYIWFL